MADSDVLILMARGSREDIEAVARGKPCFQTEIRAIATRLAAHRVSPDYAMVEKLVALKRQLIERRLEEEGRDVTKKPRQPS